MSPGLLRPQNQPPLHALLLDGVYIEEGRGEAPRFVETPAPTDAEIKRLVETVATRAIRLLVRRGLLDEGSGAPDLLAEDEPAMADLLQASAMGTAATGERAGRRIRRVLADPEPGQRTGDLKWSDGTTRILLSPTELIGRLPAIVPPKGFNGIRYHGLLPPRARLRPLVVPSPRPSQTSLDSSDTAQEHAEPDTPTACRARRTSCATLPVRPSRTASSLNRQKGCSCSS